MSVTNGVTVVKISTMNSSDLFSFLDEVPQENEDENEQDSMQVDVEPVQSMATHKRRAESPTVAAHNGQRFDEPGPSVPKRPRIASPKPIVLDDFETEAKREVAVSAGLTGSVDPGARLELKHQVCSYSLLYQLSLR